MLEALLLGSLENPFLLLPNLAAALLLHSQVATHYHLPQLRLQLVLLLLHLLLFLTLRLV